MFTRLFSESFKSHRIPLPFLFSIIDLFKQTCTEHRRTLKRRELLENLVQNIVLIKQQSMEAKEETTESYWTRLIERRHSSPEPICRTSGSDIILPVADPEIQSLESILQNTEINRYPLPFTNPPLP